MKAILEFDLPEDKQDFTLATNGINFWHVLYDLDQSLRSKTKYAPDDMPEEVYETISKTREKLHQILGENSVDFND